MSEFPVTTRQYKMRKAAHGKWEVYDTQTGLPVFVQGQLATGLSIDDADNLTDILNGERPGYQAVTVH
ncbi:hypothetical protein [Shinella granuli]|uniref:Uncharacterized protein n=1 Tax=Shinella granuli TaxID=323621 RepID=A0A4R2CZ31_SHIGR|nr:hypothetical protein [Shinella granuli]TCN46335.1 hypothetical protein EV665_1046 [Shinella granuli]